MTRAFVTMITCLIACSGPAAIDDAMPTAGDAPLDMLEPPLPPPGLRRWMIGNAADRVATSRAGIILMGGGTDVDDAFRWQRDRIGGGDVVVLRASGADGYNTYLQDEIGGTDSVETMLVDTRALALEPYVKWQLDHAEAIFIAGGDQAVYVGAWDGSPVADAIAAAWGRGAVVGGTSAGCAFLAGVVYAATNGSVVSGEALEDPYDPRVTLIRDVVALPPIVDVVTDTHFAARDRMGRLAAFVGRAFADSLSTRPLGLGVDEATALVIDETGLGTVMGQGAVYVMAPAAPPARCSPGQSLAWASIPLFRLEAGDRFDVVTRLTTATPATLSVDDGVLSPTNPY